MTCDAFAHRVFVASNTVHAPPHRNVCVTLSCFAGDIDGEGCIAAGTLNREATLALVRWRAENGSISGMLPQLQRTAHTSCWSGAAVAVVMRIVALRDGATPYHTRNVRQLHCGMVNCTMVDI